MRCVALVATAAALSAPNIRVAEVPKLADRIEVTTVASPIGHTEAIHFVPSGDIFVDDDALIASQVTATRSRMIAEDATFFHRAGPRREVVFGKGEARACIVTCGGVCPGLNTVVRELYLCLAKQYGVNTVYGVQNGYSGFKNWGRDAVKMDSRFVYEIQRKGGTVLRSSRGGHDTSKICDALIENGVNMLFVIGGDGTMKGACKIDAEMQKRGKKCVVCCVPKTIDNDVPLIDNSFGFTSAVEAAIPMIEAANTEAEACPNGIGIVKLMGRHSGFIALHATLASGDVDLCLVPESSFEIEGIMDHLEAKLRENNHALVVVAEGAGQAQMGAAVKFDASGNALNEDVGLWLKSIITKHFAHERYDTDPDFAGKKAKCFLVDPTYAIRAVPANAYDQVYCSSLAHAAVHGAMAGYTRFLVGNINTRLAMLPLDLVVNRRNIVAIRDRMWTRLLFSTGQPPFDAVVTSDDECDAEGLYRSETATGGCTVSFGDEY
mmetsp:Transcript_139/g.385  ORF Transcript_139/g.385 Transcript_139/m.385 type:complete len:493 (+) Transcript_139:226-1704(+)